jgi:hypothetical protein
MRSAIVVLLGLLTIAGRPFDVVADDMSGCLGNCSNKKKNTDGWCGNCSSHCTGGSEAECTDRCNAQFGPWNEGPCINDCENGKLEACYRNCNGNKGCEGSCGGDGLRGCKAGCNGVKSQRDADRAGCLAGCGGQKGCRDSWCVDEGTERKKCYEDAQLELERCEGVCRKGKPKCDKPQDWGFFQTSRCDGKWTLTRWSLGWTWTF